jgi:UDP-N-acetylmuramyl pentapeptide phosphotransferase/UDP-N-acetylglucosamine-1-phosphate transferase
MSLATVMVLSALVAWGVAVWVRHRAEALCLVQAPNHRSSHDHPTPNGGGLGIVVAGSLAGVGLGLFSGWTISWFVLGLGALLAAVGLRDDIQHLPARVRFGVQVAVCAGLLFALGDLPSISFRVGLEFELGGWVLSGLLLLAGVWWINLFNFMDGIDGIAGVQAVFMLLGAAALAAWTNADVISSPVWMLMLCVAAATVGFLLLNWPPAKIFMGDVGSTRLAFMVFALALLSVQAGWLVELRYLASVGRCFCDRCDHDATHPTTARGALVRSTPKPCLSKTRTPLGRAPARHVARCRRQHAMAGPIGRGLHRVATVGVWLGAVGVCAAGGWCDGVGGGKAG